MPDGQNESIEQRKTDHIDLCATGDVGFRRKTTLLDEVELVHNAVPELSYDAISTTKKLFGKTLRAPLIIAAMTGGTPRAREINKQLASIAEELGLGFGLGSQRAMLDPAAGRDATYAVRDIAPTTLVLGNIGGVQARDLTSPMAEDLVGRVGADALCVHLNPGQELIQPGGDRDFRGVVEALGRLAATLSVPVVAKETGCGLGPVALSRIRRAGVRHVDVSGSGGTSWVAVEAERAEGAARSLGLLLREWGVPTGASILCARGARPRLSTVIATGGIQTGLDVARAIALGADAAGMARPVLQALLEGGREAAVARLRGVIDELRGVMLLTGSASPAELTKAPRILGPGLRQWRRLARRSLPKQ